jgi:aminodeoxyfutalosine deaminase
VPDADGGAEPVELRFVWASGTREGAEEECRGPSRRQRHGDLRLRRFTRHPYGCRLPFPTCRLTWARLACSGVVPSSLSPVRIVTSYTARWVLPLDRPPLPGGVVTIDGDRIVAVEPHGTRPAEDLGDVALLPGFVNAHTHLDLTGMAGVAAPSPDFTGWLRQVIGHRRTRSPEQIRQDIAAGIAQSLRYGTTLVGDISGDGSSWDLLAASPLRAVVFRELLGLPPERAAAALAVLDDWRTRPGITSLSEAGRARLLPSQEAHQGERHSSGDEARPARQEPRPPGLGPLSGTDAHCQPGVSPHAPYSVHADLYRAAAASGLPVCTHLAESREELQLLADHDGPFVDFLRGVGVWHPEGLASSPTQVVELLSTSAPVLLAHANYLPPDTPLPANVTIVYCPRTHAAFGHPPHPFLEFLSRGVRVALGTDSLASNPDLDILAEVRFLRQVRPEVSAEVLLRLATDSEALGVPRGRADLVAVPVGSGDPYEAVIESDGMRQVMIGGRWVTGERHP